MALKKRALVDVQVPIVDANGEVAERVGRDVDAADKKTVALHRREGAIVPDDLSDRIRRRHVASSSAIVRDARPDTVPGWPRTAELSTLIRAVRSRVNPAQIQLTSALARARRSGEQGEVHAAPGEEGQRAFHRVAARQLQHGRAASDGRHHALVDVA